jgi:uncharacterized protein YjiS (DUF1127 family)
MHGIVRNARLRTFGPGRNGPVARTPLRTRLPWIWRVLARWRCTKCAVAHLQTLDERMLKDIGIERSEIESVVRGLGRDDSRINRT